MTRVVLQYLHGAVLGRRSAPQEYVGRGYVQQCLLVEPGVDGGHSAPFSRETIVPARRRERTRPGRHDRWGYPSVSSPGRQSTGQSSPCLLYTSDAADEEDS